jgi:prepilin-type N-terminal cleavage/methylation domain-containing protein
MRAERGLTVVEVLLTVIIFSVVAAAVYRVLAVAVKANERVDRSLTLNLKILSAAQQMEEDLGNAVLSSGTVFEGSAERISMLVAHADHATDVRYERREQGGLARITDGRESLLFSDSELNDSFFSFGYIDPDRTEPLWREDWDGNSIPFAVRWSAHIVDGAGFLTVERTIFIPHGEWGRL